MATFCISYALKLLPTPCVCMCVCVYMYAYVCVCVFLALACVLSVHPDANSIDEKSKFFNKRQISHILTLDTRS